MGQICFVHMSDLHLRSRAAELINLDGVARFRNVVGDIKARGIDPAFFVITGDLAEGDCSDYRFVRRLIEEEISGAGVQVFVTLGNNDPRGAFREGYLDEAPLDEPYYYQTMVSGLRIIALDSTLPGKIGGRLDDGQLVWLKDVLETPAPKGSIILLHHPPLPTPLTLMENHLLSNADSFARAIEGSDVMGILSGHVHFSSAGSFHGAVCATSPAVLYGLNPHQTDYFSIVDSSGYNLVMVKDRKMIVRPMLLPSSGKELFRWHLK
jgi:Icc protein